MNDYSKDWEKLTDIGYIRPESVDADEFWKSGKSYAETFYKLIGSEDTVLDFGCGIGRVSKYIQCKKLYLHDVNEYYLSQALKNTTGVVWDNDAVDWVVSVSVFIHMKHHDAETHFMRCASAAKKGMLLQIPIYDKPKEAEHWFDVSVYSKEQLDLWANNAGFELAKAYTNYGLFSFSNIGSNHYVPHLFLRR
jgi:hypothetical protein